MSTATLTASVVSIPASAASHQTTPTLSQTTPTLSSDLAIANKFVFSTSKSGGDGDSDLIIPVSVPLTVSNGEVTSVDLTNPDLSPAAGPEVSVPDQQLSNGGGRHGMVGVLPVSSAAASGIQQAMPVWRHIQVEIAPTTQVR